MAENFFKRMFNKAKAFVKSFLPAASDPHSLDPDLISKKTSASTDSTRKAQIMEAKQTTVRRAVFQVRPDFDGAGRLNEKETAEVLQNIVDKNTLRRAFNAAHIAKENAVINKTNSSGRLSTKNMTSTLQK